MLHHLSQPVAFATAPLGPDSGPSSARKEGSGSDTDLEDPISRKFSRSVGLISSAKTKLLSRNNSASDSDGGVAGISTFPPKPQASALEDDWDEDELDAECKRFSFLRELCGAKSTQRDLCADDNMADSFCLIPSKSEPSAPTLKKENSALKVELDEAQRQLASANKALKARQEQDLQLRDSIMLARKEVSTSCIILLPVCDLLTMFVQAQRAMTSSMAVRPGSGPVDLTTLNIAAPPVPSPVPPLTPAMPRDREAQLVKKIRDLEDEIRAVRVENEKQVRCTSSTSTV